MLATFAGSPLTNLPILLEYVMSSSWGEAIALETEGESLSREHTQRSREAIALLTDGRKLSASEAYSRLQSAGSSDKSYGQILDALFRDVRPQGSCNREYLILAAASALCWPVDDELRSLNNPWMSVLALFHAGYNCGFEESADSEHVDFVLFYGDQEASYGIV